MFSPANQAIPQQVMVCFKRPILIYLPENTHSKLWHPIPLSSGMENNRYKTHHPCPLVENNHRLYYLPAHFTIYYSRKYPSLHMLDPKKIERRHKEEILLLRIRNLIEQCNNYEAEQKHVWKRTAQQPPLALKTTSNRIILKQPIPNPLF